MGSRFESGTWQQGAGGSWPSWRVSLSDLCLFFSFGWSIERGRFPVCLGVLCNSTVRWRSGRSQGVGLAQYPTASWQIDNNNSFEWAPPQQMNKGLKSTVSGAPVSGLSVFPPQHEYKEKSKSSERRSLKSLSPDKLTRCNMESRSWVKALVVCYWPAEVIIYENWSKEGAVKGLGFKVLQMVRKVDRKVSENFWSQISLPGRTEESRCSSLMETKRLLPNTDLQRANIHTNTYLSLQIFS